MWMSTVYSLIVHCRNGAKFSSGKHSTLRLTGMAAANALGEKFPLFVIGKSLNSRCLKSVKNKPCQYRWQKKVG